MSRKYTVTIFDKDDPEYQEFSNPVANMASKLGNIFAHVPGIGSALTDALDEIAKLIEGTFGEDATAQKEAIRAEMTREIQSSGGRQAPSLAETAVGEAMAASPADFVGDLRISADAIRRGIDLGAIGEGSVTENLREAVGQGAAASPSGTANALQAFNDVGLEQIKAVYPEGSEKYKEAVGDLGVLNGSMAGAYYDKLLESERTGATLTDMEREAANGLSVEGVAVQYDAYLPGDDVSKGKGGQDLARSKDAHEAMVQEGRGLADGTHTAKFPDDDLYGMAYLDETPNLTGVPLAAHAPGTETPSGAPSSFLDLS